MQVSARDVFVLVGRNIKLAREARGLTREQVALTVGVSYSTVARWEQGIQQAPYDKLAHLAVLLHKRGPDEFFSGGTEQAA